MKELNVKQLGVAFGVAWGLFTFLGGMVAGWLGWGVELVQVLGSIYIGFDATLSGSLIGAVWGFANGFVWGALIAWLYNIQSSDTADRADKSEKNR